MSEEMTNSPDKDSRTEGVSEGMANSPDKNGRRTEVVSEGVCLSECEGLSTSPVISLLAKTGCNWQLVSSDSLVVICRSYAKYIPYHPITLPSQNMLHI